MKRLNIYLTIIITMLFSPFKSHASAPDFAFPQQVIKDSEQQLKKALDLGDGKSAVNAIIKIGIAKTSISKDSLPEVITCASGIAATEKAPVTASLLDLLIAQMYLDYYMADKADLDARTDVDNADGDMTLWSGNQFKGKISGLIDAALANADALSAAKTADYSEIINADKTALLFYPTLFDFASVQALSMLDNITAVSPIFPIVRLTWPEVAISLPNVISPLNKQMLTIADNWVTRNAGKGAPEVEAIKTRFNYLKEQIVPDNGIENGYNKALISLYRSHKENPYAIEFVLECNTYSIGDDAKELYAILTDFAKKNPGYINIDAVRNFIKKLEEKRVNLTFPSQVSKGVAFEVKVDTKNINSLNLNIYRLADPEKYFKSHTLFNDTPKTLYASIPVKTDGTVPFNGSCSAQVTIDEYGVYFITSSVLPPTTDRWLDCVRVSDIAIFDGTIGTDVNLWTVNPSTGAPIEGVDITATESYSKNNSKMTFKTDADGYTPAETPYRSFSLKATKGVDIYGSELSEWVNERETSKRFTAFLKTDLAIYHPGDKAQFVAVAYSYDKNGRQLLAGTPVTALIRDANYQPIDTISGVTDAEGRFTGSFDIPGEGLTGYFRIDLRSNGSHLAMHNFMVSDYKLPTYRATIDSITANTDGSVTIKGKAVTYSDFPVADAKVELSLTSSYGYFSMYGDKILFHTAEATTDAEGCFSFIISAEELKEAPFPDGSITASILTTSPAGENRTAERRFSIGKPYSISASLRNTVVASTETKLDVSLRDMLGEVVDDSFSLTMQRVFPTEGETFTIEASSTDGVTAADLSTIPSGTYNIEIASLSGKADPTTIKGVVIYRPGDTNAPSDSYLWIAPGSKSITLNTDKRCAVVTYATNLDDAWMQMTLVADEKVAERRWIRPSKGINTLEVTLPDDVKSGEIILFIVNNLQVRSTSIDIEITDPADKLIVKVETLRDRVTPLSDETLTITVTDGAGTPVRSAAILDMYSKALDAIQSTSWRFIPSSYGKLPYSTGSRIGNMSHFTNQSIARMSGTIDFGTPQFNLYNRSFMPQRFLGMVRYSMSRRNMEGEVAYAMEDSDSEVGIEPVASISVKESKLMSGAGSADEWDESFGDDSVNDVAAKQDSDFSYRAPEVPLAFFAPSLTTDDEGRLSYTFTVPNANTTWMLNAVLYDNNLVTSLLTREIIAAKPVMVQPNLPRFIRKGDKAIIRASVMNNSDETATVTTVCELLLPGSETPFASWNFTSEIAPKSSEIVTFPVSTLYDGKDASLRNAIEGATAFLVRVKSSTGNYADGEQTLLPILPSSQPVIDATTFYISPDNLDFKMPMPAIEKTEEKNIGDDVVMTLSFCENPTWEVVSALPGLRSDADGSSLAASAQIFAAAVSRYVMEKNPQVENALKEWLASAKESGTLLSMLSRNEDLKQLVLAATPWVQEAQSDEDRMNRLALLFDSKEIDNSINQGIKTLEKLQCSDGGWKWTDQNLKSSEWVTLSILNNFAELRELGCFPAQLDGMVAKAWKFVDSEVAKDYEKYPQSDFFYYSYVRSLYPEVKQPTGAAKASKATIQRLLSGWKPLSPAPKAAAALLLWRSGYKNVAKEAMKSLNEFATYNPQLGMWWDSVDDSTWWSLRRTGQTSFILQAYNTITPGTPEVDRIRQWLILNKTVQDWGTSVNASACVAAILSCGSDWLYRPGEVKISVGGKKIKPTEMDKLTGRFTMEIEKPKGDLSIKRKNEGPAWGAVLVRSTQMMSDIAAASLPELSISKTLLTQKASDAGSENVWGDSDGYLNIGERVKVRLVINSARDMDYVTVVDNRSATMEPVIQTPRPVYCDGICFYLENRNDRTNLFIDRLPKGQYVVEYEMYVNNAGTYSSGIATIQSQYTPEMTAHSAGKMLNVND